MKTRLTPASFSAVTVKWTILTIFPAKARHLSVITDIYISFFLSSLVKELENRKTGF